MNILEDCKFTDIIIKIKGRDRCHQKYDIDYCCNTAPLQDDDNGYDHA